MPGEYSLPEYYSHMYDQNNGQSVPCSSTLSFKHHMRTYTYKHKQLLRTTLKTNFAIPRSINMREVRQPLLNSTMTCVFVYARYVEHNATYCFKVYIEWCCSKPFWNSMNSNHVNAHISSTLFIWECQLRTYLSQESPPFYPTTCLCKTDEIISAKCNNFHAYNFCNGTQYLFAGKGGSI